MIVRFLGKTPASLREDSSKPQQRQKHQPRFTIQLSHGDVGLTGDGNGVDSGESNHSGTSNLGRPRKAIVTTLSIPTLSLQIVPWNPIHGLSINKVLEVATTSMSEMDGPVTANDLLYFYYRLVSTCCR